MKGCMIFVSIEVLMGTKRAHIQGRFSHRSKARRKKQKEKKKEKLVKNGHEVGESSSVCDKTVQSHDESFYGE